MQLFCCRLYHLWRYHRSSEGWVHAFYPYKEASLWSNCQYCSRASVCFKVDPELGLTIHSHPTPLYPKAFSPWIARKRCCQFSFLSFLFIYVCFWFFLLFGPKTLRQGFTMHCLAMENISFDCSYWFYSSTSLLRSVSLLLYEVTVFPFGVYTLLHWEQWYRLWFSSGTSAQPFLFYKSVLSLVPINL